MACKPMILNDIQDETAEVGSKLTIDLAAMKVELSARENPVSVNLARIGADLTRTKHLATAEVYINLDFHNKIASASPNIDAIYFYTGKGWTYKQDGQDC